ncbi:MAG: ABC transporter permease [Ruthenibacterium sp.]
MKTLKKPHINFGNYGIVYALILFWGILILTNANFRGIAFYENIFRQASFTAICGVGMTFAIISGVFDLSIASQVALSSVVLTLILPKCGIVLSTIIILCLGALMGAINGLLVAKMRIPAFIATLAMQYAYRAAAQMINPSPVVVSNKAFTGIAVAKVGFLPVPFLIMIVIAMLGTLILRKTRLGRNILAMGNSREAARISGINLQRTQILVFILVGLFTACNAVMVTSYLGSSNYGMQSGLEFTVVSAVVLGGTALIGGKGSIFNTVVAAVFLVTITVALTSFGIDSYTQGIIQGCILVFAFAITEIRQQMENLMVKRRAAKNPAAAKSAA